MNEDTVNFAVVRGSKDGKWYVRVTFPYAENPDFIGPFDTEEEAVKVYDNSSFLVEKLMVEKLGRVSSIKKEKISVQ